MKLRARPSLVCNMQIYEKTRETAADLKGCSQAIGFVTQIANKVEFWSLGILSLLYFKINAFITNSRPVR